MNGENRVPLHAAEETIASILFKQSLTRKVDSLLALLASTAIIHWAIFTRKKVVSIQNEMCFFGPRLRMNLLERF